MCWPVFTHPNRIVSGDGDDSKLLKCSRSDGRGAVKDKPEESRGHRYGCARIECRDPIGCCRHRVLVDTPMDVASTIVTVRAGFE